MRVHIFTAALIGALFGLNAAHAQSAAPGAPGVVGAWTPANKHGFGTSTTTESKVWFTIGSDGLNEVYYPRLDTPSIRDLQFVVSDGRTFAERESTGAQHRTELVNQHSLTYRQIGLSSSGRYRLTKTFTTDPSRSTLLVDVDFESLDGRPYQVYALLNPGPGNSLANTAGGTFDGVLVANNGNVATAFSASPRFTRTSNGYLGTSDGWQDVSGHLRMDWTYASAAQGNVVQTGQTVLDGVKHRHITLAIGFGETSSQAEMNAQKSLTVGFTPIAAAYAEGWDAYLRSLRPTPESVRDKPEVYNSALMALAAHEDKTYRGAFVASPSMPWVFGHRDQSGAYHLVWARDLYQMATSLLAAGDRGAAERAMTWLFNSQQKADGSFPQNSQVDGTPRWTGLQVDQVAFPIILAWQLGRFDNATYLNHVKKAADFIVAYGPTTQQERWEEQSGYSPATIAAEIAALTCASDIARKNGDAASTNTYATLADTWQRSVESWTVTHSGPYSVRPYYLRLTKDGKPDASTAYDVRNSGPSNVDQRAVVDPSFLELVRLGVKRADDPIIRNTLTVVDGQLGVETPNGKFWHRYNFDGYGEQRDGSEFNGMAFAAGSQMTIGRIWPIFAGERGEYDLLANDANGARLQLAAMGAAANDGLMIPEQVWDFNAPSGQPGFVPGTGSTSATPLAWSEAQYVRLALSIDRGEPVELPTIVECRYTHRCRK
ncbi:glycoside hydrolase family 15 protein [Burkholderia sp. BCC1644]|uniref:glycoside hydrolase family 15 protein n=1 Tax=Burkholderia sp. BCC1644 TaxID=2676293 RepID=UPI00159207FD|nr:glycoside hydrolase family 15 protein [Burkholderia sp. BCC1644]